MIHRIRTTAGLALIAGAWISTTASAATTYTFTDLPIPAGQQISNLGGFSPDGTLIGYYTDPNTGTTTNFTTTAATPHTLTVLPSDDPYLVLSGINDDGLAVGHGGLGGSVTYKGGTTTAAPAPPDGLVFPVLTGINDSGTIVGLYSDATVYTANGLTLSGSTYTPLTNQAGYDSSVPFGINTSGVIVGYHFVGSEDSTVSYYRNPDGTYATLNLPTTLMGTGASVFRSAFLGVNDAGTAVGALQDVNHVNVGVIYANGVATQVVDPNADPASGGTILTGIDGRGDLAGAYTDVNGAMHVFVATPNAVPEPSSLAMMGVGALGGLVARRQFRRA